MGMGVLVREIWGEVEETLGYMTLGLITLPRVPVTGNVTCENEMLSFFFHLFVASSGRMVYCVGKCSS